MIRQLRFWTIALALTGCNTASKTDNSSATNDSLYLSLPDSLFAYHNFKNSILVHQFDRAGFTDSTKRKKIVRIDSMTVVKLLCPINVIKQGGYSYYMTSYHYISKQTPIGDIQPIIIWGNGDDYSDLILLTLDKKGNPVDQYTLHKNDCSGTETVEDSLMGICPIRHSTINFDKIKTYINNICYRLDTSRQSTINDYARIDSISYQATISPSGKIESKEVDSVRFNRIYKL
jgi:hypothetical protein